MPLQNDGPAPYAPPAAITQIIDRARNGTLPTMFDPATLTRLGVPESLSRRTLSGMKLLDLVNDDGTPGAPLEAFRRASTEDFKPAVADWLRTAYADVFQILGDLGTAKYNQVEDAFRTYEPGGQRARMVTLFLGLCDYAELLPEGSELRASKRDTSRPRSRPQRPRRPEGNGVLRNLKEKKEREAGEAAGGTDPPEEEKRRMSKGDMLDALEKERAGLHPLIAGLLQTLPPVGSEWPQAKRDHWLDLARASFNVIYDHPDNDEVR
jgi:uncharacterized protein DUF5343